MFYELHEISYSQYTHSRRQQPRDTPDLNHIHVKT